MNDPEREVLQVGAVTAVVLMLSSVVVTGDLDSLLLIGISKGFMT